MRLMDHVHHAGWTDHASSPRVSAIVAVAAGGAIGALARYGVSRMWPNGGDAYLVWRRGAAAFPWTTLLINAVGCFLMGVLTISLKKRFTGASPLLSPLLGTGVLGGFTTFSTYTDDARRLFENGQPGTAVGYLALTVGASMSGVLLAVACVAGMLQVRRGGSDTSQGREGS
ncbi:chromosome condensation protein CrcB [Streptomyces sp. NRRL WC-3605]|nr:chromosome condensation protein CrcB [Streptomyces sp. NRRL WC-3604]KUL78896.1 chromosome condensation protein CrcB [Streptomyces sp. NRRL WC-3605]